MTRPSIAFFEPRALDDRRVVLVDDDSLGPAEILSLQVLELHAQVLCDRLAAGQYREVFEHRLAAISVGRRLDRGDLQRTAQLINDECGERLAVNVLGDDEQRTAGLCHFLEHRQQVLEARDLLLVDDNERILERDFHALGIGHEIGGQIAPVELHPFDHLERRFHRAGFLHGNHAVLADLLYRLGDDRPIV